MTRRVRQDFSVTGASLPSHLVMPPAVRCREVPGEAESLLALLFPQLAGLRISRVADTGEAVVIFASPAVPQACCPWCGQPSARVHGRYERTLAGGTAGGRPLLIALTVRRFLCREPECGAVTFAEQAEGLTGRRLRRTLPLREMLAAFGLELAGRAGARLAGALGIPVHRTTMIRLVMDLPEEELGTAPRVLGVDDFATRKGRVYGTVLVDIEGGGAVDLLPDREAGTLREWLESHPGAEVICRDRAGAYAQGARAGAPDAVQVADRWHLLHNLCGKTYEAAAAHRASCLGADGHQHAQPEQREQEEQDDTGPAGKPRLPERTRQRHAQVRQLLAAGHDKAAISRILGLSAPTVTKYAKAATAGEITPAARESALDPWKPYLIGRWNAGIRDATMLHAEITAQGYTGSDQQVRRFIRPFRGLPGPVPEQPPAVPPARKITAWLMTSPGNLTAEDTAALAAVTAACPHLRQLQAAIRSFCDMITGLAGAGNLEAWLAAAATSHLDQLRSFARGIRKDHDAVLNGLTLPWNSGKNEGNVNKIKMLKRQMYGRSSFPLLRKRTILHPA
jgi:transposase